MRSTIMLSVLVFLAPVSTDGSGPWNGRTRRQDQPAQGAFRQDRRRDNGGEYRQVIHQAGDVGPEASQVLWRAIVKYRYQTRLPTNISPETGRRMIPSRSSMFTAIACAAAARPSSKPSIARTAARPGAHPQQPQRPRGLVRNGWHMFDGSLITFFPRPREASRLGR